MLGKIAAYLATFSFTPLYLAMMGSGVGALLVVFGLASAFRGKDPVLRRIEATAPKRRRDVESGLLQPFMNDPRGIDRVLMPTDRVERSRVRRHLEYAGLTGPNALRNYYLARILLAFALPLFPLGAIFALREGFVPVSDAIARPVNALGHFALIEITALLVAFGFFLPALWLRDRALERKEAIENAFPNTLDLLQISVEAGLGLDAAIIRVANEISAVAPEISSEFLAAEREVQAGRNRDKALLDMAERTNVEEVRAFVNVVLQSSRFGTAINEALMTFSHEMRQAREMKAHEMANKLPVKLSGVMATLMMPALLIVAVGPVVIRYLHAFGN